MSEDQDGLPVRSAEAERTAARDARRRWAREVTQALQEQRLSIHATAKAVGISPGRLQAWLSQDVEPSPRAMKDLARVIGRGHLYLLQLLEWLPADVGDMPLRWEASDRLREALADAAAWVTAAGSGGLLGEIGTFLANHPGWEITVRAGMRGRRFPVHYTTDIDFRRTNGSPDQDEGQNEGQDDDHTGDRDDDHTDDRDEDRDEDRAEIIRSIGPVARRAGSRWLDTDDLVLSVPVLCVNKPRGLRPALSVPPSIVVVGIPNTGCREVAALLAAELDWAHVDVRALAHEQFGLTTDVPAEILDRAQATVAQRLLTQPDTAARCTVWSCEDPKPILQTFREIGPDLPLVVQLRAPDRVLDQVAHRLGADSNPEVNLIEAAQHVVGRALAAERDPSTYLILDLPEEPFTAPAPDQDAMIDTAVDLVHHVTTWLHSR